MTRLTVLNTDVSKEILVLDIKTNSVYTYWQIMTWLFNTSQNIEDLKVFVYMLLLYTNISLFLIIQKPYTVYLFFFYRKPAFEA